MVQTLLLSHLSRRLTLSGSAATVWHALQNPVYLRRVNHAEHVLARVYTQLYQSSELARESSVLLSSVTHMPSYQQERWGKQRLMVTASFLVLLFMQMLAESPQD